MSKTQSKKFLLHCAQGETVRFYNNKKMFQCDIGTLGIDSCVVVIIKDKGGNISLTHLDATADLGFIEREIEDFIEGDFTIDVCAIEGDSIYVPSVLEYVKENYPAIKNMRGNQDLRRLKHPVNLQDPSKILPANVVVFRSEDEVKLIQPDGIRIDENYKCLDDGTHNKRVNEQSIRQFFKYLEKTMPRVMNRPDGTPIAYEEGRLLSHPDIVEFLGKVEPILKLEDKEPLYEAIRELAKRNGDTLDCDPNTNNYLTLLPRILERHFEGVVTRPMGSSRVTGSGECNVSLA